MQAPEFLLISKQKTHIGPNPLHLCKPDSFAINETLETSNFCYTFDYASHTNNNKRENGRKIVLVFNSIFFCIFNYVERLMEQSSLSYFESTSFLSV